MAFLKGNFIKIIMILTIVCFLSDLSFRFSNITKANDSYFWIFMLMIFLMVTVFIKDIRMSSESLLNNGSLLLFWGTLIVLNLFYIFQRSFVLWGYFMQKI